MDSGVKELSAYRLSRAKEDLETSALVLSNGMYKASMNRSYYAIFHALRAITALDGFDSKKHSGIISYFNRRFVKAGQFDASFSHMISDATRLRQRSDYDDFYIASRDEAEMQLNNARLVVATIETYLQNLEDE